MEASHIPATALTDGGHACCFYDSDEEQQQILLQFVRDGVASGRKVVCIADAASTRRILDEHTRGPAGAAATQRGQLVVMGSDQAYLEGGYFDPDRMLERWTQELDRALADGYPGLRVTGDVTWYARNLPGVERLMEYEQALGDVLAGTAASALCQYDRRRMGDDLLEGATTHHGEASGPGYPPLPETFRVVGDASDVVRLLGELDMAGTPLLSEVLNTAVADGAEALSIDLGALRFMDASGASALCRPAVDHGVAIELGRPQPVVRKVLNLLGTDRLPLVRLVPAVGQ